LQEDLLGQKRQNVLCERLVVAGMVVPLATGLAVVLAAGLSVAFAVDFVVVAVSVSAFAGFWRVDFAAVGAVVVAQAAAAAVVERPF
jgi:hypothetical protein